MITAWLGLDEVPGPNFRALLRQSISRQLPLVLIVDARSPAATPALDRIAVLLRLRRHAKRRGGEIILVADHALRHRLQAAGLGTWLRIEHSPADAWSAVRQLSETPEPDCRVSAVTRHPTQRDSALVAAEVSQHAGDDPIEEGSTDVHASC